MTSISALIVEDEILIAETIRIYLEERGHSVTDIAVSYDEAVSSFNKVKPDVVLLDVRLYGEKSGIDFANFLLNQEEKTPFIFLTSQYDRRIVENAMSTNPQGYLTKPIQKESLWTTTELAFHNFAALSENGKKKLHLNNGNTSFVVDEDDILFINSEHVYINIYVLNHDKIVMRQSLADILELLDSSKFIQNHRSYIVNINHIRSYDANQILLEDHTLPLSRSRKEAVVKMIKERS